LLQQAAAVVDPIETMVVRPATAVQVDPVVLVALGNRLIVDQPEVVIHLLQIQAKVLMAAAAGLLHLLHIGVAVEVGPVVQVLVIPALLALMLAELAQIVP
jgi:hypothetical protein